MKASKFHKRNTFGIIDPKTGKIYRDIIRAFVKKLYITIYEAEEGKVHDGKDEWKLHCDDKLWAYLEELQYARVIVSFQHRTSGLYAEARLVEGEENA